MSEYIKNFDTWNEVQKQLNSSKRRIFFKKRDIWWASLGVNIGSEIDGKHEYFERPVLVIKKISAISAFVVPLTSTIRENDERFVTYEINGKKRSAAISQARAIDIHRFRRRFKYKMSNDNFVKIITCFRNQFPE